MIFTTSHLGAQHIRGSEEKKSASSIVGHLGKALDGISPSFWGRQVVEPSSLAIIMAQYNPCHTNRA